MIYKCLRDNCGFLFSRAGEPECCPDCGGRAIKLADAIEQQEFENRKKAWDDDSEKEKK